MYSNSIGFLGTLLRCYMVLTVTSDLMRFSYLLAKDAWRADAFEAYRRLLVGDAWKELDEGELYTHSWSQGLSRSQRTADFVFQCMLHLSLDVVPISVWTASMFLEGVSKVQACYVALGIGLFHILLCHGMAWPASLRKPCSEVLLPVALW